MKRGFIYTKARGIHAGWVEEYEERSMTLWQQLKAFFTPSRLPMTAAQADAQAKRWWGPASWAYTGGRDGQCRLGHGPNMLAMAPDFETAFASASRFGQGPRWRPKDQERE